MTQRYDLLPEAAQRLARVPRTGRLLARLPPSEYGRIKADADVYWKVYTFQTLDGTGDCGLLADGLKSPEARRLGWNRAADPPDSEGFRRYQVRRAAELLGAIAFEMMAATTGPVDAIETDYDAFRLRVLRRFLDAGACLDQYGRPHDSAYLSTDWDCVLKMDSHGLKHFIFSTDARDQHLRWTDVTTMAFFAAYWVCRWEEKDRDKTRAWVIDPIAETNRTFREFWTFAAEMPDEAIEGRRECWQALFTPLYDGSLLDKDGPIRSTEFIYRTWDRMKDALAQQAFLAEFPAICRGQQGAARKKIADDLLAGFILLVQKPKRCKNGQVQLDERGQVQWEATGLPNDTGTFQMGALVGDTKEDNNPEHTVVLSKFALHQGCVNNLEFELFDECHKRKRWFRDEEHPLVKKTRDRTADDLCPVVQVSWYDAWCFAKWLCRTNIDGVWNWIELPTEAQWEYACRAGRQTPFTFHKHHDGLTCTADVCNFAGYLPFPDDATRGNFRQHTVPTVGPGDDDFKPNRWGFWHLHGNVSEWCVDWYSAEFYSTEEGRRRDPQNLARASARVDRSGGWSINARYSRSAYRNGNDPGLRVPGAGFRLAAVPAIGAKSSEQA